MNRKRSRANFPGLRSIGRKGKFLAATSGGKQQLTMDSHCARFHRIFRLEDLVAHEDIINIITNLIDSDNLPHLLLYGPPGTGKTSTITAAAKKMYGKAYSSMTLELNASDARGIGVSYFFLVSYLGRNLLF